MKYTIGLLLAAQLLFTISCSSGSDLQITSHTITVREFTGDLNTVQSVATVTGTARNKGNSVIQDCVISVIFYDGQRNVVGTSTATRESLDANEVWNFTVQLKGQDAWKVLSYDIEALGR